MEKFPEIGTQAEVGEMLLIALAGLRVNGEPGP